MKKKCSKCEEVKNLSEFNKNKNRKDGHETQCRECRKIYKKRYRNSEHGKKKTREYYWNNVERERARLRKRNGTRAYVEYQRRYREENKERINGHRKRWLNENEEHHKMQTVLKNNIYFARKKGLTIEWDEGTYNETIELFDGKCCLTGRAEKLHMDHFIAIETGHGGTYKGNMIPLSEELNHSKSNKNPFEWIEEQPFEIQERFNSVVEKLAKLNDLGVTEFEHFIYWCYGNKRTEEEIKEQKTSSLDLWKNKIKVL